MILTRRQLAEIAEFDRKNRPEGASFSRKTMRYNYIVPGKARRRRNGALSHPDVTVLHVAVRLDGSCRQVVKAVGRWDIGKNILRLRDIDYHGMAGWIVEWREAEHPQRAKPACSIDPRPRLGRPIDSKWWDGGKWQYNTGLTFPFHPTVNPEALKGTRYEYCQYSDSAPGRTGLVDWLMLYNLEPKIELLAKAGLHKLVSPSGIQAMKDRRIREWILSHREDVARTYRMQDVLYAARHGVSLAEAERRRLFVRDLLRHRSGPLSRVKIDYDRLRKAMFRWHIDASEYWRYLECAIETGQDPRNDGTLYPPTRGGRKDFMARLERLEAEVERKLRAEERRFRREQREKAKAEEERLKKLMKVRLPEIAAFQKSLDRTATLHADGYTIVLAKTQKELIAEGRRMGNCVGNGTYGRGIVAGGRLIVMLGLGGKSYCDIEIDRSKWTVRQCYLKGNVPAPEAVWNLARLIAARLKEEHRRHRKNKLFVPAA